jgi:hypothetical protein
MLEATPPQDADGNWTFEYWFANQRDRARQKATIVEETDESLTFEIPIEQPHPPGIRARLRVKTSEWNRWHEN